MAVAVALAASLLWVIAAGAQVQQTTIYLGRASADGARVNRSFMKVIADTGALAADDHHLYWTSYGLIGRSNLDGSGVDPFFIRVPLNWQFGGILQGPVMLAVGGDQIYWTTGEIAPFSRSAFGLWRANLDGSGIEPVAENLPVLGAAPVSAIAAGHVYWTNQDGTIGRSDLDGSQAQPHLIATGFATLEALAIAGDYVYWAGLCHGYPKCTDGVIGRARLDGSDVLLRFISGLGVPKALAVSAQGIYWADSCSSHRQPGCATAGDRIGRADLDGSHVQRSLITMPQARVEMRGLAASGPYVYFTSAPLPWVQWLRIEPRTFSRRGRLVGGRCNPESRANRSLRSCVRGIKLQVSFKLKTPATVYLAISRRVPGRMVNGRCVTPTPANRNHRSCTRLAEIPGGDSLQARLGRAGINRFIFDGRLKVIESSYGYRYPVLRALTPGAYLLSAWAYGLEDKKSVPFWITG